MNEAVIENGFARVGSGSWISGTMQPTAVKGSCVQKAFRGWLVPDRARLRTLTVDGTIWCSEKTRPFLTHLTCAAPLAVVSDRILLAPAEARSGAALVRLIPFSFRNAICITNCESEWVIVATQSRLTRVPLEEDELLTVRPEAAVAWTTRRPTGFCPRISLRDIFIPKQQNRNLMLHFYGPGIVWLEGSNAS